MEKNEQSSPEANKMNSQGHQNLSDYYQHLPKQSSPKADFVRLIAEKCIVSEATVRLWLYGRTKPSRHEFYRVLSELTGIPVENLFKL